MVTPDTLLRDVAASLDHLGEAVSHPHGAWYECVRPGCGMGATADYPDYPDEGAPLRVQGAAVTFQCCGDRNA